MSYQGQQVNFSQPSQQQFNSLMMEVGRQNSALYTYPQQSNLASAKSDTDIWNHLNRYVWGKSGSESSPRGNWNADPNAIVPNITKNTNSIKRLEAKIQSNKDEHGYFHDTLQSLGDSQTTAKTHRDSLESKIQSHSHNGGNGEDCGWFGEKCWDNPFEKWFPTIPMTAILAAVGIGGYMLLKGKKL